MYICLIADVDLVLVDWPVCVLKLKSKDTLGG